jgi:type II secretion system protein C
MRGLHELWWRVARNGRPEYVERALTALILLLLTLLSYQLAQLTLLFITPRPPAPVLEPRAPAAAYRPALSPVDLQRLSERDPFAAVTVAEPASRSTPAPQLDVAVKGTAVGDDGIAYAILLVRGHNAQETVYRVGDELLPGIRLQRVERDRVVVLSHGREETLLMEQPAAAVGMASTTTPQRSHPPQAVLDLSQHNLNDLLGSIELRPQPGSVAPAGLQVTRLQAGGALQQLGLGAGDVIRTIDGHPVHSVADLATLYQTRSEAKPVRVELLRDGQPLTLDLTVRGQPGR